MDRTGIVNIINFIRAVEPRDPELDLIEPVVNQIRLVREHELAATWLMQYDALLDDRFINLMRNLDENQEIGAWFEIPQPLVEHAGLKWRGRPGYAWDWHSDVGFSVGYTPSEREKLADVFMTEFKRVFGKYPASVSSWFMDAHLLGYLADKYGIVASCNCRDQYGTDGYTMWGGYYSQAYYPSRKNAFMPAQNASQQIPVPVFRMLGSDPIYQYSASLGGNGQGVVTLEPVYAGDGGGGDPEWVKWFLDVMYGTPCISFAYTQVGQENSFGWPSMKDGLTFQISLVADLAQQGVLNVETLEQSGRWFKSHYEVTPSSAITALKDWKDNKRKSVWYNSRYYRTNLFWGDEFQIRDIHLFDETYAERYLTDTCTKHDSVYDTLPICDGFVWSDETHSAAIRLVALSEDGSRRLLTGGNPQVEEQDENLVVKWTERDGVSICITCRPDALEIIVNGTPWQMEMTWAKTTENPVTTVESDRIEYVYNNHNYHMNCLSGSFVSGSDDKSIIMIPADNTISLGLPV